MIGIYAIRNTLNNKMYIGESTNIILRWKSHKVELNNNTHHNYKLQQDWNEYGEKNFHFKIIEVFNFPDNTTLDKRKLNICLLCREYYHMKQNHSISQGYNIEYTLRDLYKGQYKDKDKQEYYGDDFQQLIKKNIHLFQSPYNLDDIIKFAATDIINENTFTYKPKKIKLKNPDELSIARINKYIQKELGVKFTRYQLADLLIEWNYIIETGMRKYKATEQGLLSGDIVQHSRVFLTEQGLAKIVDYIKDIYDIKVEI